MVSSSWRGIVQAPLVLLATILVVVMRRQSCVEGGLLLTQNTLIITSAASSNAIVIYDSTPLPIFSLSNTGDVVISSGLTISGGGIDISNSLSITGGLRVTDGGLKTTKGLSISNTILNVNGGLIITGGFTLLTASSDFYVTGGVSIYGDGLGLTDLTVTSGGFTFLTLTFNPGGGSSCPGSDYGCSTPSDFRFKSAVTKLTNHEALRQIMATRPVSYTWREDAPFGLGEDRRTQVGFIAQELQEALDHEGASVVHRTPSPSGGEIMTVDYGRLTALLAGAIQAQEEEINDLASKYGLSS